MPKNNTMHASLSAALACMHSFGFVAIEPFHISHSFNVKYAVKNYPTKKNIQ